MKFVSFFLATVALMAQSRSGIGTPYMGFVLDSSMHAIRPIIGLPGSATLGAPMELPFSVLKLQVAPASNFALAVVDTAERKSVALIQGLASTMPTAGLLDGAIPDVDLIAINATGTTAMLVSNSGRLVQFVTGLPDQALASTAISTAMLGGEIRSAAVESSAARALVAVTDEINGGIHEISSQGPRLLFASASPSSVAYLNGEQDAVFAEAARGMVTRMNGIHGTALQTAMLASPADGTDQLVALEVVDGSLVIASAKTGADADQPGRILLIDLATGRVTAGPTLPVIPSRLARMSFRGLFATNEVGQGPLYLYSASDSVVAFVPPSVQ